MSTAYPHLENGERFSNAAANGRIAMHSLNGPDMIVPDSAPRPVNGLLEAGPRVSCSFVNHRSRNDHTQSVLRNPFLFPNYGSTDNSSAEASPGSLGDPFVPFFNESVVNTHEPNQSAPDGPFAPFNESVVEGSRSNLFRFFNFGSSDGPATESTSSSPPSPFLFFNSGSTNRYADRSTQRLDRDPFEPLNGSSVNSSTGEATETQS